MEHAAVIGAIEAALRAWLEGSRSGWLGSGGGSRALHDAVEYALLGGGKRLRPVLAWRCAEAVGGVGERSLPGGVAVELVHAFSLVHDDLPALDNDALRRGRATLHVHAGEAMAVLAGDALLNGAYDAVERMCSDEPAPLRMALVRELASGTGAMIVGQALDTLGGLDGSMDDLGRLRAVHAGKTGALIRAACRMGAMLGAGTERDDGRLAAITGFGERIGLVFQIVDDLLDVEGSALTVGKATGKDAGAGKLTYPGVLGVEGSRAEIRRLQDECEALVAPMGAGAAGLLELSRTMAARDR